jgi:hypothetical protein
MCDALSRNTPKLTGIEILLANCIAHGRRQFTEVAESFPDECRYVLESIQNIREMSIAAALDARTDWESARLEFLEHERSHFRKS